MDVRIIIDGELDMIQDIDILWTIYAFIKGLTAQVPQAPKVAPEQREKLY